MVLSSRYLVSIIIPVYNGSRYLQEAIDSALTQTYRNVEVIVVNDGSNDNEATRSIAMAYGSRIIYMEQENQGVGSALNSGIRAMNGEYFSWLSHDDIYSQSKIERQINAIQSARRTEVILYSDYEYITSDGAQTGIEIMPDVPANQIRHFLLKNSTMNGCTMLIPRKIFNILGNFREDLRNTQDYDYWLRAAEKVEFLHVPGVVLLSRRHKEQGSRQENHFIELKKLYSTHLRTINQEYLDTAFIKDEHPKAYAELCHPLALFRFRGLLIDTINRALRSLSGSLKASFIIQLSKRFHLYIFALCLPKWLQDGVIRIRRRIIDSVKK